MKKIASMCALAVGLSAVPASALTITATSVTVNLATDVGAAFVVSYGGLLPDLSAYSQFSLASSTATSATFNVRLLNSSDIDSRLSAFGFNTDPNTTSGSVGANPYGFSTVHLDNDPGPPNSMFPNLGHIEVCTSGGATCQGGAQPGIADGQLSNWFTITLNFGSLGNSLVLSNFAARYQSVGPTGTSSTGNGSPVPPGTPTPFDTVPEPTATALFGLGLLGAGLIRRRK